ncbi:MAG: DUF3795 domain-containing protein [Deltaproteobacteria bacterium]|nr:DUF3795 domain-containing protein [Deltaproteobacteria bacterium]
MISEKVLNALGPCGLNCETCFAHADGEIRKYSLKLKEKLGNFEAYAKRFETLLNNPVFEHYPEFKSMLDYPAAENCQGCRKEKCRLFDECGVRSCHRTKGVDFCFQCNEFPCGKTNFDGDLQQRWVQINQKIREQGLEKCYEDSKTKPRY